MARQECQQHGEVRAIRQLAVQEHQGLLAVARADGVEQGEDRDLGQAREDRDELCLRDARCLAEQRELVKLLVEVGERDLLHHADRPCKVGVGIAVHLLVDGLQLALQPVLDVPGAQRLGFEHESLFCQRLVELAPLVRLVGRDENQVAVRRHVAELAHKRLDFFRISG